MCTVPLPPGVNPIAVKYIISNQIIYWTMHISYKFLSLKVLTQLCFERLGREQN